MPSIGTQIRAPKGFRELEQSARYHFLDNNARTGIVSLVQFWVPPDDPRPSPDLSSHPSASSTGEPASAAAHGTTQKMPAKRARKPQPRALLVRLHRNDFEAGLTTRQIEICPAQEPLPPWFKGVSPDKLRNSDKGRYHPVRSHSDRLAVRLAAIQPAVDQVSRILASDEPVRELGVLARACQPRVNETRFCLWFFAYLAFGRSPWALHYSIAAMGHWDRLITHSTVHRGAANLSRGAGHGHNADTEMVRLIVKSYLARRRAGRTKKEVYRLAITKDFGCSERKVGARSEFYHPQGRAFPTAGMYWDRVRQELGIAVERRARIGARKERTRHAPFVGSFSADASNLMERVEADAFTLGEVPRGLLSDSDLRPLAVVRIRDVRSGLLTGIGFSLGAERASAYRMAKFVQAVDKVWLCALFGIVIRPEQWPNCGASPNEVQDRGAGVTADAFPRTPEFRAAIVEGTPSRSPQSKALIESSNPRKHKTDDKVEYTRSDKNAFELCVQEIRALIVANDSMDISDRIPNAMLEDVGVATPVNLWRALDARMRNDALPMERDEAIRAFLTPAAAKLTRRGVELHGRVFGSKALDASGARNALSGNQRVDVQVYVLEACVRHVWLDFNGKIVQLDMMTAFRAGEREVYITLSDLTERARKIREMKRDLPEHSSATESTVAREFDEQTGKRWRSAKPAPGRAKYNTKQAKAESRQARDVMTGRKG